MAYKSKLRPGCRHYCNYPAYLKLIWCIAGKYKIFYFSKSPNTLRITQRICIMTTWLKIFLSCINLGSILQQFLHLWTNLQGVPNRLNLDTKTRRQPLQQCQCLVVEPKSELQNSTGKIWDLSNQDQTLSRNVLV